MKKSVLALAVLGAFAGAASAQSSVTLYGRLDTSISYTKPFNGDSITRMSTGVSGAGGADPIGGSRWGLRGTEDLGGGLRANFVLESGFDSGSGAAADSAKFFNRQAFVGLASDALGEVRLGRQQTLTRELDLLTGDISAEGELNIIDTNPFGANRPLFQNFGTRVDNAAQYISPSFGGFQVRGLVAAGEGVSARQQGLMGSYSAGPLKVGLAYEEYDKFGNATGTYNKVLTVGGSYNFGIATVLASYQDTTDFGTATAGRVLVGGQPVDHNAYNIGAMVPFGNFELRAQYTRSKIKTATAGNLEQDKYGASVRYNVSKRTQLYAVATQRGGDNEAAQATTLNSTTSLGKKSEFAVGIGHNF